MDGCEGYGEAVVGNWGGGGAEVGEDEIGCGARKLGAPCTFISKSNARPTTH